MNAKISLSQLDKSRKQAGIRFTAQEIHTKPWICPKCRSFE